MNIFLPCRLQMLKKVKTGIKTKGANGKPVATEAPYGYIKDPNNKDFWILKLQSDNNSKELLSRREFKNFE